MTDLSNLLVRGARAGARERADRTWPAFSTWGSSRPEKNPPGLAQPLKNHRRKFLERRKPGWQCLGHPCPKSCLPDFFYLTVCGVALFFYGKTTCKFSSDEVTFFCYFMVETRSTNNCRLNIFLHSLCDLSPIKERGQPQQHLL